MTSLDTSLWVNLICPAPLDEKLDLLLTELHRRWPVDALCVMHLKEPTKLLPVCIQGLSTDTLGREFILEQQPRLQAILSTPEPVHFAHDAELRDPFDGLIPHHTGELSVHDCMGIRLEVQNSVWGLLTLDALEAGSFPQRLQAEIKDWVRLIEAVIQQDAVFAQTGNGVYSTQTRASYVPGNQMVGNSQEMTQLYDAIATVAQSDLTVLIQGETGTGKELVAQSLHDQSSRSAFPFVFVNCAALPEQLAESELFGHIKGAFTGAVSARKGKFELADKGTLFLDEVGELPLSIQAKLLRVIQSGDVQRVGSDQFHHVDVRIVAATNRNLAEMVSQKSFRADLYHRLSVYPIEVPALRDRHQDVLLLAGFFIEKNRAQLGLRGLRLTGIAEALLMEYHWPGNVRELEHCIARAALKARAEHPSESIVTLTPSHLDLIQLESELKAPGFIKTKIKMNEIEVDSLQMAVKQAQTQAILSALEATQQNWRQAAVLLKVDSGNLHRLAKRLGLK